jgi:hypothetical protein
VESDRFHIAQVNIALAKEPLESPLMAEFVAALDPVNALADRSPGFVWRLQTEDGNATSIRAFDDDRIIVNMSVWKSVEHLRAYTYTTPHAELLKQRRDWFEKFDGIFLALWWVPVGHIPTVDEAKDRLASIAEHGATPFAFTFKRAFTEGGDLAPL